MKRSYKIMLPTLLFCFCCTLYAQQQQEKEAPPIVWQKDIDSALKEAYLTGRPLFLHFCPEGRIALNEDMSTLQDNRVKTWAIHFIWVRLDPEKFKKLGDQYGVKEIPSLVVVNHEKKKLNKTNVEGHAFPEDVAALIKQVLQKIKKIPKPKDIESIRKDFEGAQKYLGKKNTKQAVKLLKKVARSKLEIGFVTEAQKALKSLEDAAKADIEKARKLFTEGKDKEGDKILRAIESEFRGLDVASEARKVRLELYSTKDETKELLKKENEKQAQKLFNLGQMYEQNNKLEKALEQYRKILKEYPNTNTAEPAQVKVKELSGAIGEKKDR